MFPSGRGLIVGAVALLLGSGSTPYWYVGGTNGSVALWYGGDSIWVYASGVGGPFAFHASTTAMASWADNANIASLPDHNSARLSYQDPTIRDNVVLDLIRLSADSSSGYLCRATAGRWSAGVVLSPDSARRFLALLHGRPQVASNPPAIADTTYFDFQVQKQAFPVPGITPPAYPEPVRVANVEGEVLVQFAVDTLGLVDFSTVKFLKSTNPWFASAVLGYLPRLRLTPALIDGHKVRELIQQPYAFNLKRRRLR